MKMDSDGNGKGEMWIGAPGWASANVNEVKVRDYDLLSFIEPIRAEESVKTARVKDSIAKNEGTVRFPGLVHRIQGPNQGCAEARSDRMVQVFARPFSRHR
jgi:hypothetical protein